MPEPSFATIPRPMSEEALQICPQGHEIYEPGCMYCPECGADLSAPAASGGAGSPENPQEEGPARQDGSPHPEPPAAPAVPMPVIPAAPVPAEEADEPTEASTLQSKPVPRGPTVLTIVPPTPAPQPAKPRAAVDSARAWTPPAPFSAPCAPALSDGDLVPFDLQWDAVREFVEGVRGSFALRVRGRRRIHRLDLTVTVNGTEELPRVSFRDLEADGIWQEQSLDFVPRETGVLTVRLSALETSAGRSQERFEVRQSFEHTVRRFQNFLPVGSTNISIDNRDNRGIIRLDSLRLPAHEAENVGENIERALSKRDGWQDAPVCAGAVLRNCVLLRSAERSLLVVAGSRIVTFGRRSSQTKAILTTETADGLVDEKVEVLVSRIQFSVQLNGQLRRFELRDGGPDEKRGIPWKSSSNRTRIDGVDASAPRPLDPGRSYAVELAPGLVSGGPALRLSLETRGWDDPAAEGTPHTGNLSSILVRYPDNPRLLILVVWGGASIGEAFGDGSAAIVRNYRGRLLFVDRPGGRPRRLRTFEGGRIPGTPYVVL